VVWVVAAGADAVERPAGKPATLVDLTAQWTRSRGVGKIALLRCITHHTSLQRRELAEWLTGSVLLLSQAGTVRAGLRHGAAAGGGFELVDLGL
jgi:hypothetical protein